jgi:hypothetical protein
MKKFVYITGSVSISLMSIGFLFRMMHWPGTGYVLVAGIGIFSLLFIPGFFKYKYDKGKIIR